MPDTTMSNTNSPSGGSGELSKEEIREKYKKMVANFVPYDPRFPNQNQTKNCQTNYIDYYRCLKAKNGDENYCAWYKNAYKSLCPPEWYEHWDEQRANGTFPIRDIL